MEIVASASGLPEPIGEQRTTLGRAGGDFLPPILAAPEAMVSYRQSGKPGELSRSRLLHGRLLTSFRPPFQGGRTAEGCSRTFGPCRTHRQWRSHHLEVTSSPERSEHWEGAPINGSHERSYQGLRPGEPSGHRARTGERMEMKGAGSEAYLRSKQAWNKRGYLGSWPMRRPVARSRSHQTS
jgi:hypothetical protein